MTFVKAFFVYLKCVKYLFLTDFGTVCEQWFNADERTYRFDSLN